MRQTKLQVQTILEHYPETRDENADLAHIFYTINHKIQTWKELLNKIQSKEVPSYETICRLSRQIQQENTKLRGEKWAGRQSKEDKVKKDLGYNFKNK